MLKRNIALCITALLLFSLFAGCGSKNASVDSISEQAISVEVSAAVKKDINSAIAFSGRIKPNQEINIVPKVPGKVSSINFEVGQAVKEGDILFTLDNTDASLQVSQAEAGLANAKVSLQKTKGGAMEQQLSQLKSALANAETQYNDAKTNYDRVKEMYAIGGVSKQSLEQAETSYKLAKQQYDTAKTSLSLTQNKINPENTLAAEAGVKQAQAAYDLAKTQLDNTIFKSPIAGVVAARNIEIGEQAGAGTPAMTVIDLSSVTVDISVPENVINKVVSGDKVQVKVSSAGIDALEGKITSISPAADAKSQSYPVKISIANEKQVLKSGMFAEVQLTADRIQAALVVPLAAIVEEHGNKYVFVADGDTARKREVKAGAADAQFVQILNGVEENEQIVSKGQNLLQDGSKITLVKQ